MWSCLNFLPCHRPQSNWSRWSWAEIFKSVGQHQSFPFYKCFFSQIFCHSDRKLTNILSTISAGLVNSTYKKHHTSELELKMRKIENSKTSRHCQRDCCVEHRGAAHQEPLREESVLLQRGRWEGAKNWSVSLWPDLYQFSFTLAGLSCPGLACIYPKLLAPKQIQ